MILITYFATKQLKQRSNFMLSSFLRIVNSRVKFTQSIRGKQTDNTLGTINSLVKPVTLKKNSNNLNIGLELTGALDKSKVLQTMYNFSINNAVKQLCDQHGLDDRTFISCMTSFRKCCIEATTLSTDLYITLNDIIQGAGHVTDLIPYFMRHIKQMYPHIDYINELKKISDLTNPSHWYSKARSVKRKIIFHAGPTNSGKTYQALQRFISAKSGIYCGPLRLLASEVFTKCNSMGTPCDLITGEEHKYAKNILSPADHISCSIEMANLDNSYDVAVIDEIQLLRDPIRGWAWTRALLGLVANEIHICGEYGALSIVQSICLTTGEVVEVKQYQRLTELKMEDSALCSLHRVLPGDCIVCFSRGEVFSVSQAIEKLGHKVAVIYGSLPPGTKLAQAARFNDPKDPCKILVATNAIGMGLNLHIRRIIFYSLTTLSVNDKGQMESDVISVSTALQIAGRAGRYGTQWSKGYVTTYKIEDFALLKNLLEQTPEELTVAGLHPTADQIELYGYYLPTATLSNIIDIFIKLCQFDNSLYFICNLDDFKFLADMIQHMSLSLRTRYIFCCAPINRKIAITCNMFLKFARRCSMNEPATISWLCSEINWPPRTPGTLNGLLNLEHLFDILDIYLWLSYRMPDLFPHGDEVRQLQLQLDEIIDSGVKNLIRQFKSTEQDEYENKKLSMKLINQGLLTPHILKQLKMEWS
ncbi:hypothetical protein WN48_07834, partial [Eufriesea mexicana]